MGEVFAGRYEKVDVLGRGGMGQVFRVRDRASGNTLALKQLAKSDASSGARVRFRREFHTMSWLAHPRIVEVFEYGIDRDAPFYTMELLDGSDLAAQERVPWRRACSILRDVASALAFLHVRGLVHRDLAPRNVRTTSDGRAKLIDFGVLATIGAVGEIAGTPPFVAPEVLRGAAADHRCDLYGLGALAFRVLTGGNAFPARSFDQLELVWRTRPAPPSAHVESPAALDDLVLQLLSRDPLARPASAAEVIDRLTTIAELDPDPEMDVAHGWIASTALVGRQRELQQIRRAVESTLGGSGRSLVVEAPSGTGKTRLLRELTTEAQLAGMTVLRADGQRGGGPYAVVRQLARAALASAPEAAARAAEPRAAIVMRAVPELASPGVVAEKLVGDAAEDRMRIQQALTDWLLSISTIQPIAVCVDDLQRCDEASAAVLAAVAHRANDRVLLVATGTRTDEPARAPAPLAALRDAGQRIRLRGLDEAELREWLRAMFGDVQHVPRLASWLHRSTDGTPLLVEAFVRRLVDANAIRYLGGAWVLPDDPAALAVPSDLAATFDARVGQIPPLARSLAEVLAVYVGELTLQFVVELAEEDDEATVFAAVDALVAHEVLAVAGDRFRFRHDALREALLRGLDDDRARALHRRVGEILARHAEGEDDRDAEIGWHLFEGGQHAAAAKLLEKAGRRLWGAQSFADSIRPLEAALEICTNNRGSARVRCELLHMLLMAGCMADRATALRHAEDCVAAYRYWSGMDVADRARGLIGRHLGIGVGLFFAFVRWMFSPRRGPWPYEAFRTFFIVVGYAATMHSMSFDFERTRKLVALLEPIAIFRRRIPYAVYLLARNTIHFPMGEVGIAEDTSRRILEILERDRITPIRDIDRRTGGGGALYMIVLAGVMNLSPTFARDLEQLRHLGLKFFDIGADQAMVVFHRVRGQEAIARELEEQVELRFVQLGSVWQMEAFMPVIASLAYAFVRDTLGLRRAIEQLSAMCDAGFRFGPLLDLARGEYLRERGDLDGSARMLVPIAAREDFPMVRIAALCALAELELERDDHAAAREYAERAIAVSSHPRVRNRYGEVRAWRALALAEAATDPSAARRRLDAAIVEVEPGASALLSGALHEARALVAIREGDLVAFKHHANETQRLFRDTRNPALVVRAERVVEAGARAAKPMLVRDVDVVTQAHSPRALREESAEPESLDFARCRGPAERAQHALELVVAASCAGRGYLYLLRGPALELVAPAQGDEPPSSLSDALADILGADSAEAATAIDSPAARTTVESRSFPLVANGTIIGGVLVLAEEAPLREPPASLLAAVGDALFVAGDVASRVRS